MGDGGWGFGHRLVLRAPKRVRNNLVRVACVWYQEGLIPVL